MEQIKQIVEDLEINEKRAKVDENKKTMLRIKREMSDLTFNINVAKYAHAIGEIRYLYRLLNKAITTEKKLEILDKIEEQRKLLPELETDSYVIEYKGLMEEYESLAKENSQFYRSINVDFRTELLDLRLPDVYVYQGTLENGNDFNLYRHLMIPGTVIFSDELPEQTIYPSKEVDSNRRSRHYYNKISYKYLDQLSQDYELDPQTKKLGKVKTKSRGM